MISVCSMARHAASSAAAMTKSVSVRPWISEARFRHVKTSFGRRVSSRAAGWCACFKTLTLYGRLPYGSTPHLSCDLHHQFQLLPLLLFGQKVAFEYARESALRAE